jgi:hypothetical protein
MFIEQNHEESNLEEFDLEESQLNIDLTNLDEEDLFTQLLWEQILKRNRFASRILEILRNNERHHSRIQLVECEDREDFFFFRNKRYVSRSNRLRLRIIKLAHDSVVEEHSDRSKCHELINRIYWWLNMHQFIKRFVRNCHTCKRFKSSRQRYQDWLRSFSSSERRWRDVFMNYVKSLNFSIFMRIIYRYILVFIDRLFKMRHFVLISTMKVEKVANSFYQNVWKLHDLLDALISNRDT